MGPLRWGIIGAGLISHDFLCGMSTLPRTEHVVLAVAARDLKKAEEFSKLHGIEKAYGDYEKLITDPNIDIVYIGLITSLHLPLSKLCLQKGKKHVLVEKPMCVNVKETQELIEIAKQENLFLMEGVWSRHFECMHKLREELNSGSIGEVLQVIVIFGITADQGYKLKPREHGTGTMLDIGIYGVQFASFVFGEDEPEKVLAGGTLNPDGVDASTSSTLIYSNGRTATIVTSSVALLPNEGHVVGTKGTIKVPLFWAPNKLETPSKTYEFDIPKANIKPFLLHSEALCFQAVEAKRCIDNGLTQSPNISLKESLNLAKIMESIRKQVGVVYIQD